MDMIDSINNLSLGGKWQLLENVIIFNCVIALALCISSVFTKSLWGFGINLQLATTSLLNAAYNVYLFKCVNTRETVYFTPDFVGGVSLLLNIMLLQTVCMWYDLASGLRLSVICWQGENSSPEKAVTTLATFTFLAHSLICFLVFRWRDDLNIEGPSSSAFEKAFQRVRTSADERSTTIIENGSYQQGTDNAESSQFVIDNEDAEL